MAKLAIHGGIPVLPQELPKYRGLGPDEARAAAEVVASGCLSAFYGSWGDEFLGGPKVKEFERAWCARFRTAHAVSMNSATSGLIAAMGAIGIGPGDEVIVPPYTMSATAMAPLFYGGIPVFADIDPVTFCLDPAQVEKAITPRTRAILAVNLFGHPAPLARLRALADARGLKLVEDNAQGPLAEESGRLAGTVGHIGVFSLNYHKHVHAGEGGVCVTDDAGLALRLQLIRNHAENIAEPAGLADITNMVGFNFRLTELSAAIGLAQLAKVDAHVRAREELAEKLTRELGGLEGIAAPEVRPGCRHVHYLWCARLDEAVLGVSRERFSRALAAEGFPHFNGYVRPLYLLPVFQRRQAIGSGGWPFSLSQVRYEEGSCPVAERMHFRELLCFEICMHQGDGEAADRLVEAFRKVHAHRKELG